MEIPVELTPEHRKEWVAPELKQIDIEQITTNGPGIGSDGGHDS